jgi:hypothetical protein
MNWSRLCALAQALILVSFRHTVAGFSEVLISFRYSPPSLSTCCQSSWVNSWGVTLLSIQPDHATMSLLYARRVSGEQPSLESNDRHSLIEAEFGYVPAFVGILFLFVEHSYDGQGNVHRKADAFKESL